MTATSTLRHLLHGDRMIRAPGVYDGITAKLAEQAGFPAVYMTGAGTSVVARLSRISACSRMTEMAANAATHRPRRRRAA